MLRDDGSYATKLPSSAGSDCAVHRLQHRQQSGRDPGEIVEETPLLNPDGTVAAHGWSRGPLMQYDRSLVQEEHLGGLREWECYAVFAPDFAIGLTLEDYATEEIHSAILIADASALDFPPTPSSSMTCCTSFLGANGTTTSELRVEQIRGAAEYVEIIW